MSKYKTVKTLSEIPMIKENESKESRVDNEYKENKMDDKKKRIHITKSLMK